MDCDDGLTAVPKRWPSLSNLPSCRLFGCATAVHICRMDWFPCNATRAAKAEEAERGAGRHAAERWSGGERREARGTE